MAITADRQSIEREVATLARIAPVRRPEGPEDLGRRLDAVVEALEILARDRYQFPGMPESRLTSAIARARRT
jgi:hypothetical protein